MSKVGTAMAFIALVIAVALAGCTGAPVGTLPGVGASVPYENAIGRGASLLVDVSMPDATDPKGTCAG